MDAAAYQMAFDMEQLAILCANYDRRIDSLDAENKQLQAENAKLRELVKDALINLSAWMGDGHPEWMVEAARELGIEVVE